MRRRGNLEIPNPILNSEGGDSSLDEGGREQAENWPGF
jgi:hypothetical protein